MATERMNCIQGPVSNPPEPAESLENSYPTTNFALKGVREPRSVLDGQ